MLNRRGFLIGTAALLAAPVALAQPSLVLWGDGVHDDTKALQAVFDGDQTVRWADGRPVYRDGHADVNGARFYTTDTIYLRSPDACTVSFCNNFIRSDAPGCVFYVTAEALPTGLLEAHITI